MKTNSLKYFYIKQLSKNKTLEFQISFFNLLSLGCNLEYNRKCSHGGLQATVILFGLFIHLAISDNRHWNDETNKYE